MNRVMKKLFPILMSGLFLASCSSNDHGELVGVDNRPDWYPSKPYGMVYIPQGSYNMGNSDQDVPYALVSPIKTVSVPSFWMDQTEITNNEYRQFVNWVRDSIARTRLADGGLVPGYEFIDPATAEDPTFYQEYKTLNYPDSMQRRINWEPALIWDKREYPSSEYTNIIETMYLPPEERFMGDKMIDARQLNYSYYWIDKQKAAKKSNRVQYDYNDADQDGEYFSYRDYIKSNKQNSDRSSFFKSNKINVYPDTLVWIADFAYSYNEPMHDRYFWHPAFDDYPVVGVNWYQARAFCNWRTKYRNDYLGSINAYKEQEFRLPTEAEWEYAARGGKELSTYPWGGPYALNSSGCYLANFKPQRGSFDIDGGIYPVEVTSYSPNDFDLYNMAGNVAEWTSTAYEAASYYYVSDLSPNFQYNANDNDHPTLARKVTRGGSWKDIAYYLQTSARNYEYADTAKSYVGFRTVQSFMGRDINDF
ncbi:MAG: SUMF1/EgtB/PvdO family nonheme iron enzyme [Schleiferiaceae bacterium]|nr:SUMF1/EgtB/PvdO family nonheme iron enzyme [Schleiferiaceae bacterium]MDR9441117.1 SUMF1/EgtB/PvdO family nonheme iron enzyme [Schleiferiaceae bacterium]